MKIRRYMLNFVEQAGEKSVQAPTILELSRKFGVSRPTVSKAMKMLTDDGYIIGRPGLGAFTNPAKINRLQVTKYKNVALIVGDGMMVHFEPYNLELLGRIGIGIARRNFKLTLIQLPTHQPEEAADEVAATPCDILLWITPPEELFPAIRQLRERGKRIVVLVNDPACKDGNLYFDYESFGYRIGKKLLAEGRRNVAYLLNTVAWSRPLIGLQKAYQEAGIALDSSLFFPDMINLWEKLEKLMSTPGRVDAIFSAVCPTSVFLPFYHRLPASPLAGALHRGGGRAAGGIVFPAGSSVPLFRKWRTKSAASWLWNVTESLRSKPESESPLWNKRSRMEGIYETSRQDS
ncbi:MAG: GntR family transcriptional regulator [Lentisphaeria bacterium]|nr:MAG: GntR family transcriptional regulator [Lentisphaeria bacterium]